MEARQEEIQQDVPLIWKAIFSTTLDVARVKDEKMLLDTMRMLEIQAFGSHNERIFDTYLRMLKLRKKVLGY